MAKWHPSRVCLSRDDVHIEVFVPWNGTWISGWIDHGFVACLACNVDLGHKIRVGKPPDDLEKLDKHNAMLAVLRARGYSNVEQV